mmetsp:Transcript_12568/g.25513  ORF Transcript_12568/g.25513 Transcript_12568/m.25513 type:complete len:282 (-) Transcript_12568:926-1771(-)|eukprot:CAMPEP_0184685114 /NCGR_PEP_ID=MMETSP0312-20130426/17721_1 /TAXON_ID=31354 /ORGANISM="Compsopogon coeruleus, Strain SAG 36.94" /LENGTH=281 /DNA_ID=CAMNT_0027138885 /DNA_START=102 /DNA_END=947 /DNA_ORIENTATION=+
MANVVTLEHPMLFCCQTIRTMKKPQDAKAMELLHKAANQVKPIMAKRRWKVLVLEEFYPANPNLLGLNHRAGQKVQIRLRSPISETYFLEYDSILRTLLHELAHNEVGPHNAQFYRILEEITAECEKLIANGVTGSDGGFESAGKGQRLHEGGVAVPRHRLRGAAAAAAERRQRRQTLMGSNRLGGDEDGIHRVCDPREMAVAAAERRKLDEIWCGSQSGNPHLTKLSKNQPIEISSDSDSDEVVEILKVAPKERGLRQQPSIPVRETPTARAALRRWDAH